MSAATLPDGKPAHRTTSCQGSGPLCSPGCGEWCVYCSSKDMSTLDRLYYWMNEKKLKVKKGREGSLYERKINVMM